MSGAENRTPKEKDTMNRVMKALFLLVVLVGTYAVASIGPTLHDGGPLPVREHNPPAK
jgi:hypothetical protein